jgi:type II restriction/modification system DNA methylase subunit YeeA
MDTGALKTFAQVARRQLREQVSARLEAVLRVDSAELREWEKAIAELRRQITQTSRDEVVERVAYTWFNRFCALRFMDVNHYTRVGIVSPVAGFTQPEILQEAKQGVIDSFFKVDRERVLDLLSGQYPSRDPQQEAYRLLLVGACNAYHQVMPFLFQPINDHTELLMPDDLLSENSVLQAMRAVLTAEACQDVEVIGWLYQFYISERKDEVFANLKKNIKIEAKDIPAATQLFTPHWIVRYLVENSLGRLWMLNYPQSRLVEQMDYYIQPEQEESDYLKISSPEEIKICDPACGSGHMLTYSFDLLYAIYSEQGYDPIQIPSLILEKNLYGIEIDERAGALAAFALVMKARKKYRRFFNREIKPNICVLRNVEFSDEELEDYMDAVGRDLFTGPLRETLKQFEHAENFGSLIRPLVNDVENIRQRINVLGSFESLLIFHTNQKILRVMEMVENLCAKFHLIVTNPPYMGSSNVAENFKNFSIDYYRESRSDLFSMFIERNFHFTNQSGLIAMITMHSWMFLSSYESIRKKIIDKKTIIVMAHLGPHAFDTIGGEIVSTTAFVFKNNYIPEYKGRYLRLTNSNSETEKDAALCEAIKNRYCGWFYSASVEDFSKIPGNPIAYWVSASMLRLFSEGRRITEFVKSRDGLTTGKNELFIRFHWEVQINKIYYGSTSNDEFWHRRKKFAPLIKGGPFRKWYGNLYNVISYDKSSYQTLAESGNKLPSREFYFRENLNWSRISSGLVSFRYAPNGCIFESASLCAFSIESDNIKFALAVTNSRLTTPQMDIINPTTNLLSGYFDLIRIPNNSIRHFSKIVDNVDRLIKLARSDWDSYETSWNFKIHPILKSNFSQTTLMETYMNLRSNWKKMIVEMQRLEEENNSIFINNNGFENTFTNKVSPDEITLNCNPNYRYGINKTDDELDTLLLVDTMKELLSYAVGCMFGRYSLDKPGLILANQAETVEDYHRQVPQPTFAPDEDNVIPILEAGWFVDDIVERFNQFLRVTFGDENFDENLSFLENALGGSKDRRLDIRSYFLKDFYKEHVKMYKKRPIYWLFSSPKGSFNALIYMHRYRPDTVSVVLNKYVREYHRKLSAHKAHLEQVSIRASASQSEKTKALKEIDKVNKVLAELKEYEDEILFPLATQRVEIDLDDGVKVNYNKFGKALKVVPGLSE